MATSQEYMQRIEGMNQQVPDYRARIAEAYDQPVVRPVINRMENLESQYLPTLFDTLGSNQNMSAAAKLSNVGRQIGRLNAGVNSGANVMSYYGNQIDNLANRAAQDRQSQLQTNMFLAQQAQQREMQERQLAAQAAQQRAQQIEWDRIQAWREEEAALNRQAQEEMTAAQKQAEMDAIRELPIENYAQYSAINTELGNKPLSENYYKYVAGRPQNDTNVMDVFRAGLQYYQKGNEIDPEGWMSQAAENIGTIPYLDAKSRYQLLTDSANYFGVNSIDPYKEAAGIYGDWDPYKGILGAFNRHEPLTPVDVRQYF